MGKVSTLGAVGSHICMGVTRLRKDVLQRHWRKDPGNTSFYVPIFIAFAAFPSRRTFSLGTNGWVGTYIHKRRYWTLWFWRYKNFATSMDCQKQSNGNAPRGVLYVNPSCILSARCMTGWIIYGHRRGAFGVARFNNPGNAKAFIAWNEWQTGST